MNAEIRCPREVIACALALVGLLAACESETDMRRAGRGSAAASEQERERNEELKHGSGRSQSGAVRPGGPVSPSTLSIGTDLDRLWSESDDWEPALAVDRSSNYVYQMTTRFEHDTPRVVFRASQDGGDTWGTDQTLRPIHTQYDPQLAVARDGTVFATWLELPGWSTEFVRSTDHGRTWSSPLSVESTLPFTDHGWLAVSDDGRDVYVAFNSSDSYVVASHDGGASFAPPVLVDRTLKDWIHTGGAVAPDGTVYFAAAEYAADYRGETNVYVLRSRDRGQTWQSTLVGTSRRAPPCAWAPGCYYGFLSAATGLTVDAAGTLAFVYNASDVAKAPEQIYVRFSLDGVNWSPRQLVSYSDKRTDNAFPTVVSGPGAGDFSVVWQGDRLGDTSAWNTWLRRTIDSGRTWGPLVRLSTREDGAPYRTSKGYAFPYGDYLNAACDANGRVHVIWGAGESYDGPGGTWFTRAR